MTDFNEIATACAVCGTYGGHDPKCPNRKPARFHSIGLMPYQLKVEDVLGREVRATEFDQLAAGFAGNESPEACAARFQGAGV